MFPSSMLSIFYVWNQCVMTVTSAYSANIQDCHLCKISSTIVKKDTKNHDCHHWQTSISPDKSNLYESSINLGIVVDSIRWVNAIYVWHHCVMTGTSANSANIHDCHQCKISSTIVKKEAKTHDCHQCRQY